MGRYHDRALYVFRKNKNFKALFRREEEYEMDLWVVKYAARDIDAVVCCGYDADPRHSLALVRRARRMHIFAMDQP
jgi:hypothetical protein